MRERGTLWACGYVGGGSRCLCEAILSQALSRPASYLRREAHEGQIGQLPHLALDAVPGVGPARASVVWMCARAGSLGGHTSTGISAGNAGEKKKRKKEKRRKRPHDG
eukprot:364460-Chlamydomonas_euryale.AAC.1